MNRFAIRPRTLIAGLTLLMLGTGVAANGQEATGSKDQRKDAEQEGQQDGRGAKREQTIVFGLHTLSSGQTMRLSMLNASLGQRPDPITPGVQDPPETGRRRRVTLVFDVYASDPREPSRSTGDIRLHPDGAAGWRAAFPKA